jgi:DNA-directed RNA polymerase specialized sigma24 family protein
MFITGKMSEAKIAEHMGITHGTVKAHEHRGLQSIEKAM